MRAWRDASLSYCCHGTYLNIDFCNIWDISKYRFSNIDKGG
jgi:hypothetical protein